MRIVDEEKAERSEDDVFSHGGSPRFRPGCLRFFGCWLTALIFIVLISFSTIRAFISPVVRQLDGLPSDFPAELTLYQPEVAKVKLQDKAERDKALNILKKTPDWLGTFIWEKLPDNVKLSLAGDFITQVADGKDYSFTDFKNYLNATSTAAVDFNMVSLTWDGVAADKQELFDYYKNELWRNNFQFKEKITDYDLNLDFWKENIFGTVSVSTAKNNSNQSKIDMTVDYLNRPVQYEPR